MYGDTVTEVLDYVQYDPQKLVAVFRRKVRQAKGLSRTDADAFIADCIVGLAGCTYLEEDVR